ncbi:hypothetical protein BC936DRAFT_139706 [Jimgerdemannia flammicorona]|uniref:Uncharacterized protein n=1 Tax=Jimgerdemannia flammicorona TaxID=994334 RepID=A0A433DHH6_9FUNG|nr:hypothetical protein BC936DRAFT_139706 [Jimgerdemannia flammicorona]
MPKDYSTSIADIIRRFLSKRALVYLVVISLTLTLFYLYTPSRIAETFDLYDAANVPVQPTRRELWNRCLDAAPLDKPVPYLSIVIVTRNDDYAGAQYHRLQNFIDSTYLLAENTGENIELLIIEWNPPADKRRIMDAYRFRRSERIVYRIITVPKEIHDVTPNIGNAPLHEFEGKNLGIRFARGEFVLCTNQDDIWSPMFHNAVKSHAFKKDTIYLQHQDVHWVHDDPLLPSIVRLPVFATDEIIINSCMPSQLARHSSRSSEWGRLTLSGRTNVTTGNILKVADQAGDFTLAHRLTWRVPRGYRETGGVAWVDIEFICTAAWTFGVPILWVDDVLSCHQDHPNIWRNYPEQHTDNKNINMAKIENKEEKYVNEEGVWGMQRVDIWKMKLRCVEFKGGMTV